MPDIQGIKKTFADHPRKAIAGTLLAVAVATVAIALIVNLATKGQLLQFLVQSWTTTTGKGILLGGASGAGLLGLAAIFTAPLLIRKTQTMGGKSSASVADPYTAEFEPKSEGGITCEAKLVIPKRREFGELPNLFAGPFLTATKESRIQTSKNRYGNIFPYDKNRYQMQIPALLAATPYINASPVLDGHRYILTQGPLPLTKYDFWNMVWDSGSTCIVMATALTQERDGMIIQKCDKYWPDFGEEITTVTGITISCTEETSKKRQFTLTYQGGEPRTVIQIRLETWQDSNGFSVKDVHASFVLADEHKGDGPIIAHCSAGVGRSGTWVAMHYLYEQNKRLRVERRSEEISIFDLVSRLRSEKEGRNSVIQTSVQYEMIYDYAAFLQNPAKLPSIADEEEEEGAR